MKKAFSVLSGVVISMLFVSTSFAHSLWDTHWTPGEYILEMTDEQVEELTELKDTVFQITEGTAVRSFSDTIEHQYEMQQSIEAGVEEFEEYYDDIGKYAIYFGLPDDHAITQDQALLIAYQALLDQGIVEKDELLYYFPEFQYIVYDSNHPLWRVSLSPWDGEIQ